MMSSVELYRYARGGGRPRDRSGARSARCASRPRGADGGDRSSGGLGEDVRPAARAVSADEAQRLFPPMTTDGVLGAAYLPTDGYIDPSQLTFALAEGARRGGARSRTGTRSRPSASSAAGSRRSRPTGRHRDRGRRQRRRHVRARDRRARRRRTSRSSRWRTSTSSPGRPGCRWTCRRCATRRCSSTSGRSRAAS